LRADIGIALGEFVLDIALDFEPGNTVALLGPNGAGKTTALRAIAGLQPIDRGSIALAGDVLDEPHRGTFVAPERRAIGVMFQDGVLFPHLSATDNVAYGLRRKGFSRSDARARAAEWLGRVGLESRIDARPATLSGGEAQRVALARALAIDPRALLLDEPLAALDVRTRADVRRELRRHLAGFGGVRILVTHDPLDALALADRVVIIEEGRITQAGAIDDVVAHPRSHYVAELVGANLFRGEASGTSVRTANGPTLTVGSSPGDGEVFAVVRPAAVALHRREPEGSPRNRWHGTVADIDRFGGRVRVVVDGPLPVAADLTPSAVADLGLAPGVEVWASVKANEIDVYPA
jgi:molybdate transport system ATP-binding protein